MCFTSQISINSELVVSMLLKLCARTGILQAKADILFGHIASILYHINYSGVDLTLGANFVSSMLWGIPLIHIEYRESGSTNKVL